MSDSGIAIVGSGIVGTTLAYLLASRGHRVAVFEKGGDYPYPHLAQFQEEVLNMHQSDRHGLPADLDGLTRSGIYRWDLREERALVVGGSATRWQALTLRLSPSDFQTRTVYGYGADWPLTYRDLEPYYCRAESYLGVSGTDSDNPFAPPRSRPYPLPPFDLAYDDAILATRLRAAGLALHTTPQARTRKPYDGRPGCMNFGACRVCPIGARYSPMHHLDRAIATGRCTLYRETSVRRVVVNDTGRAEALVYRQNGAASDEEHAARVIVVAGGAIESARLLLLSATPRHPDGLGNRGNHLGRHLTFHHLWHGHLHHKDHLFPGRFGGYTGQSHQFLDPPGRGRHGGLKIEFSSHAFANSVLFGERLPSAAETSTDVVAHLDKQRHWRRMNLHSESLPSDGNRVGLSTRRDRFGDPFAHVHYELSDFDYETYRFAGGVFDRFANATGADERRLEDIDRFQSGHHHMGTCRMAADERQGVVNALGEVHGTSGLFALGGSNFVSSGGVNPTLTMVAIAMRTADYLAARLPAA